MSMKRIEKTIATRSVPTEYRSQSLPTYFPRNVIRDGTKYFDWSSVRKKPLYNSARNRSSPMIRKNIWTKDSARKSSRKIGTKYRTKKITM
ncbi:MAG: hypothetical protein DWQ08_06575 [Proteobacteria bacterium]|nr:MAG: hypothetical protein DWQ08_06575 [Pseudomonadota bacterium]